MIDLSQLNLNGMDLSVLPPSILGRLSYTHAPMHQPALPPGRNLLGLSKERDAVLYVPRSLQPGAPVPLLLLLHGAHGSAESILPFFEAHADKHRFLLLAPQSTYHTWDLVVGGNGPDLARLDSALTEVGSRFSLDPRRLGFAGFSDGASYALSIGLTNGALFTHVISLSGGFMNVYLPSGKPQVFVAHSPEDQQLAIERSGRRHAVKLREDGYEVEYVEFHGPHAVAPSVVEQAVAFFLKNRELP